MLRLTRRILPLGLLILALVGCGNQPIQSEQAPPPVAKIQTPTPTPEVAVTPSTPASKPAPEASPTSVRLVPQPTGLAEGRPTASPLAVPVRKVGEVWQRIREGLTLGPYTHHRQVSQELRWFRRHSDYLERVEARARPYLYHIIEQVEARGMPAEIALLPVVESAFQPYALSSGRAAGLWQFIPSTGRIYGLHQSHWYDGRRDVLASTKAALAYLARLHKLFDGDWLLALAAYNSGEGRVLKEIRQNRRRGRATDFWSLDLPKETRGYVPRLLAVAELVRAPDRYGVKLKGIPNYPYFEVVEVEGQLDLSVAARLARLSVDEMYRLNPGFSQWATSPEGPHELLIPATDAEHFRQGLARLDGEKRKGQVRYVVRQGETLGGIAREHGVHVSQLRAINGLKGPLIRIGQELRLPANPGAAPSFVRKAVAKADRPIRRIYTVRGGDSLWKIARRHGVSIRQLRSWNRLGSRSLLKPGQKLAWYSRARPRKFSLHTLHYTVRSGDSLDRISRRFKVSVADLRRWNSASLRGRYIHPGQRLMLKTGPRRQTL